MYARRRIYYITPLIADGCSIVPVPIFAHIANPNIHFRRRTIQTGDTRARISQHDALSSFVVTRREKPPCPRSYFFRRLLHAMCSSIFYRVRKIQVNDVACVLVFVYGVTTITQYKSKVNEILRNKSEKRVGDNFTKTMRFMFLLTVVRKRS